MDGLVNTEMLQESVIRPLLQDSFPQERTAINQYVIESADWKWINTMEDAMTAVLSGNTVLFLDGEARAILFSSKSFPTRGVQNADQEVVDKLRSDILNTIPAWRNQMVLALGIEHTTRALNAQNALDEMTNELFRKNAETLKQGAIDAALASERSIVDVETLKKINADIITSINEVVKIHEEGSQKRAEAQEELVKIETELKDALLKAGSR